MRRLLLAVAMTWCVAGSSAAQSTSVVVNGSFETGSLAGWTAEGSLAATSSAAWDGQYGVRMDGTGRLRQTLTVTPGETYHASARLRLDREIVTPTWGGLALIVQSSSWQRLAGVDNLTSSSLPLGAWQRVDFTFTAPGPTVVFEFDNFSGGGRFEASLDAVIVSPTPIPPDPADTTPPVVAITSPMAGTTTTLSTIEVAGTAVDASGIKRVRWFNERGGEGTATGLSSWSAAVPLAAGLNPIVVEAEDLAGNRGHARVVVDATFASPFAPPMVSSPEVLVTSPRRWQRVEMRVDVTSVATRAYYPYSPVDDGYGHPEGITVDALIDQPDARRIVVPAFYHVPYRHVADGQVDVLGIAGAPDWRARFTPTQPGPHVVRFRVVDAGGFVETAPVAWDVTDAEGRGFLRVASADPRVLEYDNGRPFVPISEGRQWAPDGSRPISSYDAAFAADAAGGVNLTRIWDQNDSFEIALEGSYPVWAPKWSQFSQALGIDLATVRTGRRAARFGPRVGSPVTEGYTQRVAVEPNRSYLVSGHVRTSGLVGGAVVAVAVGPSDAPGPHRTPVVSGTADWQKVSTSVSTGPADSVLTVWVGAIASTGTAWFDDLELRAVDEAANLLSDPGFERQFAKHDQGNDPEVPEVALTVPQGTEINQWAAYTIDQVLERALAHGIAAQLCSHEDVYWTWDATIHRDAYAVETGRHVPWGDARHLGYWKRNYRYRIARWSAFTSLLAWEVWNEHGEIPMTGSAEDTAVARFYDELVGFIHRLDPARHLVTTSQGSQAFSAPFWATGPVDLANYHDYITTAIARHPTALREDGARFVYDLAANLVASWPEGSPRKPIVWGEIGTLTTWDHDDTTATTGPGGAVSRHNFTWAGLFSPILSVPIDFQAVSKAQSTLAARRFFEGEPWASARWEHWATPDVGNGSVNPITASPALARVLGLRDETRTRFLAWVQHRDHTWARVARDGHVPQAFVPTIQTPELVPGRYRIEWWDTRGGAITTTTERDHPGGAMAITGPSVTQDVAVKVVNLDEPGRPTRPRGVRIVAGP